MGGEKDYGESVKEKLEEPAPGVGEPSRRFFDKDGKFLINAEGLALVQHFESCSLRAYQDSVGVWTIGWGRIVHPDGRKVHAGDTCTQEQADEWLRFDLYNEGAKWLRSMTDMEDYLTDDEFSALVSFTYNRGCGRYNEKLDDLCDAFLKDKKLDPNEMAEICKVLVSYNFAGNPPKYLLGLDRRRWAERRLFEGGNWQEFKSVPAFTAFKNRGYK